MWGVRRRVVLLRLPDEGAVAMSVLVGGRAFKVRPSRFPEPRAAAGRGRRRKSLFRLSQADSLHTAARALQTDLCRGADRHRPFRDRWRDSDCMGAVGAYPYGAPLPRYHRRYSS